MRDIIRNFVVLEGPDGSGTTTQLSLLSEKLQKWLPHGGFFITCEPAYNPVGVLIRSALKKEIYLHRETLARLFAADRCEHLCGSGGVVEHCNKGEIVVSDRYILSSLVYQGLECGDELSQALNSAFPAPELLFYLDIDSETALQRLKNRPVIEIYETIEFQRLVREKYLSLLGQCEKDGTRVIQIDGQQRQERIAAEIWSYISKLPIFNSEI